MSDHEPRPPHVDTPTVTGSAAEPDAADAAHGTDAGDSSRVPWGGRTLPGTGFEADDGSADPAVLEALAAATRDPSARADRALVEAVRAARWIVPVVAAPTDGTESTVGPHGLAVETSTDMAVVSLTGPDGRRALPVFTSAAALAVWDRDARPVPVSAARAAQAAIAEGCDVLVVDLGSDQPTELRPSMVWALAQEAEWRPAHDDPFVAAAVARAVADEAAVRGTRLEEGEPLGTGVLRVVLALAPGLDAGSVQALATRVGERLATDGELRARVDGLTFALERAEP